MDADKIKVDKLLQQARYEMYRNFIKRCFKAIESQSPQDEEDKELYESALMEMIPMHLAFKKVFPLIDYHESYRKVSFCKLCEEEFLNKIRSEYYDRNFRIWENFTPDCHCCKFWEEEE